VRGSDRPCTNHSHDTGCFNPRSRARERRLTNGEPVIANLFQSTLPCEGATCGRNWKKVGRKVSIHAPVRGSDITPKTRPVPTASFNPRSRARERLGWRKANQDDGCFNPRSRARERPIVVKNFSFNIMFQSTLPCEGATRPPALDPPMIRFQSTLPCEGATPDVRNRHEGSSVSIHAPVRGSDAVFPPGLSG